ncbi:unnamed protein product [Paramecium sonneborni]|uniref:Derlin n=1 Tax=Paramecium sonneborni TaxID=65129 RepID=A0A8S1LQD4_9CILI|nr:unnamed protein product [Paramecium sonneborni]
MMNDFNSWYKTQPLFTRTYVSILVLFGLIGKFKPAYLWYLMFDFNKILSLQIHRLFTHYFFSGTLSFSFIFHLLFIIFCIKNCEIMFEGSNYADFYYMILYFFITGDIMSWLFDYAYLSSAFCFALIYVWCKRKPFETVRFYFGFQFKSEYFPWVLIGFHAITDQDIVQDLIGLGIAHSYLLLKDFLPVTHSIALLETPQFFKNFVNKHIVKYAPFARNRFNNQQFQQPQRQNFFQGQGIRLG